VGGGGVSFYVRTSLRAGPFRFNLSKSGLGVSAGVPGFRVGTGPRGNYVHVGRGGVRYSATFGTGTRRVDPSPTPQAWIPPTQPELVLEDTTGATATELLPTNADDFVSQLNQASRRLPLWPFALAGLLLAVGILPPSLGAIALVAGLVGVVWLYLRDRGRRSVVVFYEVQDEHATWFTQLVESFGQLSQAAGLWRINASGRVETTWQYKTNSGASAIVSRQSATAAAAPPKALVTNIAVPSITAGRHSLHFLPDRLLIRDGKRFAQVLYSELRVKAAPQRFIEDGRVPRDGQQVDTTWQYVNVKGGPDRRFKNNRQFPVMLYGRMELSTESGLQWILDCSRAPTAERVEHAVRAIRAPAPVSS
jgi:hypothetical protein